jgi:hypothetical protein
MYKKKTPFHCKGGFGLILLYDLNLMIPQKSICKRVGFSSSNIFQHLIGERGRERVMDTGCIETSQIYTDSNITSFLRLHNHRTNPIDSSTGQ